MSCSDPIQPYGTAAELRFNEIDADEQAAIDSYDYEKARFLASARAELRNTNVKDATDHYERELKKYNTHFAKRLSDTKARNQQKYDTDSELAKEQLRTRIDELAELQHTELEALEARWREARSQERDQVSKSIDTLLSSSQLLAKSHRFGEAIAMRDRARAMQKRARHPNIEAVDAEYQEQFRRTLLRHNKALEELLAQHDALLNLLAERRDAADRTAEADLDVKAAYASVEIIDVAMCDEENQDVCIPVVRHFSPRKSAALGRTRGSRSSVTEEEEDS
jgi:hypothetical protein